MQARPSGSVEGDMRSLSEDEVDYRIMSGQQSVWSRDVMRQPITMTGPGLVPTDASLWPPHVQPEQHTAYYERRLPGGGVVRSRAIYERAATESVVYNPSGHSTTRTVASHRATSSVGEREEIGSITETDVYDHWFRH